MEDIRVGFVSGNIHNVTPREALELINNGAYLLDVREIYMNKFKKFDVDNLLYCPQTIIENKYSEISKDITIVITDATGIHSKEAYLFLKQKGYTRIYNLAGGIVEWECDRLPLKMDKLNVLHGQCMCQLEPSKK